MQAILIRPSISESFARLIIHRQPRPFPMFTDGDRVMVLSYHNRHHDTGESGQVGHRATLAEKSSPGGNEQHHL